MKNAARIQHHPNQEDKRGFAPYASATRLNYSTNDPREEDIVHEALESERRGGILRKRTKKRKNNPSS
ncbi:hypothetical protein [Chryseolinea lacunae]|uniref:Uncharacterized protein n=1 Tax=Chryseolinea lacunae TaxID=2801331 RepID=A0ABS1L2E5_9BACT|nr:hypothetical protein [Chryseolinea lacunae]MBL0745117.1 hypothetical protein [Chryseolinea lacunae]